MSRRVEVSYSKMWKRSEKKALISENSNLAE
jgi:hypothetical protein